MAFLKRKRIGGGTYLYVEQSYRTAEGKVRNKILQYLGSEKTVAEADAEAAVAHWNRWTKTRKGGRRQ